MASPASDPTLVALAQLGTYRLGCTLAFVSLVDNSETYIIAEAAPSGSRCGNKTSVDGITIGMSTLGLGKNAIQGTRSSNITSDGISTIIRDVRMEATLESHPFVERIRPRLYAEVTLTTSCGEVIGTYCVVNNKPCHHFGASELVELQDVAKAVASHLENLGAVRHYRQNDRLLGGLMKFVKGQSPTENDGWKSRRKSTAAASLVSPRSSEVPHSPRSSDVPEIDRLSVSATDIREVSPSSTRHPPPQPRPESPFFQIPAFGSNNSVPNGIHQRHVRKSSDETSNLVMVPESTPISEKASMLFSRASGLLQECMDLDGVLFVDASRSNTRGQV